MASKEPSWFIEADNPNDSQQKQRTRRKPRKPVSVIDALRHKYCTEHNVTTKGLVIVFHGKPKSTGSSELDYLRNVVLSNSNISVSGLQGQSLKDLCPNVVDLDLSGNRLESWSEVLPVVSQLENLKFLNLSDNRLQNTEGCLQSWTGRLPGVENLVLNRTYLCWQDVLSLVHRLCGLKELHLCGNGYDGVPPDGLHGLETVECLRLNGNKIESWSEIWKLRFLSSLKSLILSGNPLLDVFFNKDDLDLCDCVKVGHHRDSGQAKLVTPDTDDVSTAKETENDITKEKEVTEEEEIDTGDVITYKEFENDITKESKVTEGENIDTDNINTDKEIKNDISKENNVIEEEETSLAETIISEDQATVEVTKENEVTAEVKACDDGEVTEKVEGSKKGKTTEIDKTTTENEETEIVQSGKDSKAASEVKLAENYVIGNGDTEDENATEKDEANDMTVNDHVNKHTDELSKCEIQAQTICDIVEKLEAADNGGPVSGNQVSGDKRDNDAIQQQVLPMTESNEGNHGGKVDNSVDLCDIEMREEETIEEWCYKIICDIINAIAQEMHEKAEAKLPQCQNMIPPQADTHNQNNYVTRFPVKRKKPEIGKSMMCSERGKAVFYKHPGRVTDQTSESEELPNKDNSDIEMSKGGNCEDVKDRTCQCGSSTSRLPFTALETLCLSETCLGKWKHLNAVKEFPSLKSLRIKDVKLGSKLSQDDRRKLFVACLPNIKSLNGSEVTVTEREKAERHLLRHFSDKKKRPDIFHVLEKKHGKLQPVVDIDISRGYREWVTLTFVYRGETMFTATVSVRQPVGKLRLLITEKLCLYASIKNIQLYHRFCNPCHREPGVGNAEEPSELEQLFLDSLPMSRFDIMDEDEIHFDTEDQFTTGAMRYMYLRNFLPRMIANLEPDI